jgi:hypothetical protein
MRLENMRIQFIYLFSLCVVYLQHEAQFAHMCMSSGKVTHTTLFVMVQLMHLLVLKH